MKYESDAGQAPHARKRVLFLVNPNAGRKLSIEDTVSKLEDQLESRVDFVVCSSESIEEQYRDARKVFSEGVDAVVVRGGDGAVGAALNLVAESGTPLGILPAGTGNDFARALGIRSGRTWDHLVSLLRKVVNGDKGTPVDAIHSKVTAPGFEDSRWVANSVNIGFDARINQVANNSPHISGSLRYLYALLKVIPEFRADEFNVTVDGDTKSFTASLVSIQNGPYLGGGIPLAKSADPTDTLIDISTVTSGSKPALIALFPMLYLGLHKFIRPLHHVTGRAVDVYLPAGMPVFADGDEIVEVSGEGTRVQARVVPGAVQVLNDIDVKKS